MAISPLARGVSPGAVDSRVSLSPGENPSFLISYAQLPFVLRIDFNFS